MKSNMIWMEKNALEFLLKKMKNVMDMEEMI